MNIGAGDRNRTGDVQLGNFLRARHAVSLLHILHHLAGPRPGTPLTISHRFSRGMGSILGSTACPNRSAGARPSTAPWRRRQLTAPLRTNRPPDSGPVGPVQAHGSTTRLGRAFGEGQAIPAIWIVFTVTPPQVAGVPGLRPGRGPRSPRPPGFTASAGSRAPGPW